MISIRKMKAEDVPQIAALEAACFSAPWDASSLAAELENPLSLWLTAAEGQTVAGYIGSQSVLGEADMMNLAVAPSHRRQGIARALVLELIRELTAAGVTCLTLEVRAGNAPALALYESLGFAEIGLRKNYYFRPREDAKILRKEWVL